MNRWYFKSSIAELVESDVDTILGVLATSSTFAIDITQRDAWLPRSHDTRQTGNGNCGATW